MNLYGTANVANASLYGGNREVTGNTLNIGDAASKTAWAGGNQQVKNIAGFENINFQVVPWSASQAALTITDGAASDLSQTKVSASQVHFTNVESLQANATMTLLDASKVAAAKSLQSGNVVKNSNYTVGTTLKGRAAWPWIIAAMLYIKLIRAWRAAAPAVSPSSMPRSRPTTRP